MLECPGGYMFRFCFCLRAGCSMWCHGWLPCLVLSSAAGSLTTCCPKVSIINTVLCKSLTIENKITQLLIPGNFFCISSLITIEHLLQCRCYHMYLSVLQFLVDCIFRMECNICKEIHGGKIFLLLDCE